LLLFAWWLPLPPLVNVGLLNTKICVRVLHLFTMCTEYGRCEYVYYLLPRLRAPSPLSRDVPSSRTVQ
jgi:hypothetical protein